MEKDFFKTFILKLSLFRSPVEGIGETLENDELIVTANCSEGAFKRPPQLNDTSIPNNRTNQLFTSDRSPSRRSPSQLPVFKIGFFSFPTSTLMRQRSLKTHSRCGCGGTVPGERPGLIPVRRKEGNLGGRERSRPHCGAQSILVPQKVTPSSGYQPSTSFTPPVQVFSAAISVSVTPCQKRSGPAAPPIKKRERGVTSFFRLPYS